MNSLRDSMDAKANKELFAVPPSVSCYVATANLSDSETFLLSTASRLILFPASLPGPQNKPFNSRHCRHDADAM